MSERLKHTESLERYLMDPDFLKTFAYFYFFQKGNSATALREIRSHFMTEENRDQVFEMIMDEYVRDWGEKPVADDRLHLSIFRNFYNLCSDKEKMTLVKENQEDKDKVRNYCPFSMSGYGRHSNMSYTFEAISKDPETSIEKLSVLMHHPSSEIRLQCAMRLPKDRLSMFLMDKDEQVRSIAQQRIESENLTDMIVQVRGNAAMIDVLGEGCTRRETRDYESILTGIMIYEYLDREEQYVVKAIREDGSGYWNSRGTRKETDIYYLIESKKGDRWIKKNVFKIVKKAKKIKDKMIIKTQTEESTSEVEDSDESIDTSFAKLFELNAA